MRDPEMQSSIYDRWEGEHELLYELRDYLISVDDFFDVNMLVHIGEVAQKLVAEGVKGCVRCHEARTFGRGDICEGHRLMDELDKACAFDDYLEQLEEDGLL